jgi:hypothetical protein
MEHPRGEVLSGAGLAEQQDSGSGMSGGLPQGVHDFAHRRRIADQFIGALRRVRMADALLDAVQARREIGDVERLGQVIEQAVARKLNRLRQFRHASHHHDDAVGAALIQLGEEVVACAVGQKVIEQDEIKRAALGFCAGGF